MLRRNLIQLIVLVLTYQYLNAGAPANIYLHGYQHESEASLSMHHDLKEKACSKQIILGIEGYDIESYLVKHIKHRERSRSFTNKCLLNLYKNLFTLHPYFFGIDNNFEARGLVIIFYLLSDSRKSGSDTLKIFSNFILELKYNSFLSKLWSEYFSDFSFHTDSHSRELNTAITNINLLLKNPYENFSENIIYLINDRANKDLQVFRKREIINDILSMFMQVVANEMKIRNIISADLCQNITGYAKSVTNNFAYLDDKMVFDLSHLRNISMANSIINYYYMYMAQENSFDMHISVGAIHVPELMLLLRNYFAGTDVNIIVKMYEGDIVLSSLEDYKKYEQLKNNPQLVDAIQETIDIYNNNLKLH